MGDLRMDENAKTNQLSGKWKEKSQVLQQLDCAMCIRSGWFLKPKLQI